LSDLPPGIDPLLLAGGVAGFVLLLLILSVRRVPQGFEYTVERFGRFRRVLRPGLQFLLPFADRIGARQEMRERHLVLAAGEMLTLDQVPVRVEATAFWQVQDAARASYEVEHLETSLKALLTVSLRTLVGEQGLDALLGSRSALNAALLAAADDAAGVWGVRLTRTEVGELSPPAALVEAAERERAVAVHARADHAAAEAAARARRLAAEAEREAQKLEAEARADAARVDAEAGERVAEGDARATLMLSKAVLEGDPRALNYLLARRYVDALKTLAESDNGRFVVLPLENGGIAASLTGIRELAEETFADPAGEGGAEGVVGAGAPSPRRPRVAPAAEGGNR
jgi:regulator of protease activity HflC (stomatin/prohibitin superfamily)